MAHKKVALNNFGLAALADLQFYGTLNSKCSVIDQYLQNKKRKGTTHQTHSIFTTVTRHALSAWRIEDKRAEKKSKEKE